MNAMTTVEQTVYIPARMGASISVSEGTLIRLTDLYGQQPIDFWAFCQENPWEFLSPEHTRPSIMRLYPGVGDSAFTNFRRPIVTLVEDKSPGQHDMQFAACDRARYIELGASLPHANCQDNLHLELQKLNLDVRGVIQPWNIFTNFFINPDGTFSIKAPSTQPGDNCTFRVDIDCHIIISACPQDMNDTCGGNPTDIQMEIGR